MTKENIKKEIQKAIQDARKSNPLVASITNTVTINLVANVQLAIGGSAAMIYMPDEGEKFAAAGSAMYINMGTVLPIYEETLPRTAKALRDSKVPWVLDPVGIGIGDTRMKILSVFKENKPNIIRGNASEIIALANFWNLYSGVEKDGVRGVDATDSVESAKQAALSLADFIEGAVAISGETDLVTNGKIVVIMRGGSKFLPMITGAGCALGGVMAIYEAVATPFIAALTATALFNYAGQVSENISKGPASFQMNFIDALYSANAADVSDMPFLMQEVS